MAVSFDFEAGSVTICGSSAGRPGVLVKDAPSFGGWGTTVSFGFESGSVTTYGFGS